MGLALALVYSVSFTVVALCAGGLSVISFKMTQKASPASPAPREKALAYLGGMLLTTVITLFAAKEYAARTVDWEAVIGPIAISLAAPLLLGIAALLFALLVRRPLLHLAAAGALHATFLVPAAGMAWYFLASELKQAAQRRAFDALCKTAQDTVAAEAPVAKSAALIPDSYTRPGVGEVSMAESLLCLYELDFVEVRKKDADGGALVRFTPPAGPLDCRTSTRMVATPIESVASEYQVVMTPIQVPPDQVARTAGQRIEVRRTSDRHPIAVLQYYYGAQGICPTRMARPGYPPYPSDFVARALGLSRRPPTPHSR